MYRILTLVVMSWCLVGCVRDENPKTGDRRVVGSTGAIQVATPVSRIAPDVARSSASSFAHAPDRGDLVVYPAKTTIRPDGAYTWHRADLSEGHAIHAIVDGTLHVTTPSGEALRFRYERHVEHPSGDWTWIGRLENGAESDEVILTFGERAVFGTISQPGQGPLKLTMRAGTSWLIETDRSKIAGIDNTATRPRKPDFLIPPKIKAGFSASTESSPAAAASTTEGALAAATTTFDVLLGYTSGFAAAQGGQSQAVTRLNNMVEITNQAYVNSQVDARVRLVHAMQVSYPDNTSNTSALEALTGFRAPSTRTTPDPAFEALRSARNQYGADLVSLVRQFNTPENDGCGIAWLIGGGQSGIDSSDEYFGYSVVSDGRDAGTDLNTYFCREETLAHELGHNMGSQHDRVSATVDGSLKYGVYPYSFGYKTDAGTGNFYTVMAYGDSGQVNYRVFSNPRTTFCGYACGVENEADNARSLGQTIPIVATFRATVVPDALRNRTYSDINGDGRSDLLLRNASSGLAAYWIMDGAMPVRYSGVFTQPTGYEHVATGDFNGDDRVDLVWARTSDRTLLMWLGNGIDFTQVSVRDYVAGWAVTGAADVDGDGRSDLLLRNATAGLTAYWIMNGATPIRYSAAFSQPAGYGPVATGDFNGDGRVDMVWARASDRTLLMWLGDGVGFSQTVVRDYANGWAVVGAGDIDGDGRSDLLLRNAAASLTAYWVMNGATPVRYSATFIQPAGGYQQVASGDFNGDGRVDLVWGRISDRTLLMWLGNGTGFSEVPVRQYADGWSVIPSI